MMIFVLKMMNFVSKIMNFAGRQERFGNGELRRTGAGNVIESFNLVESIMNHKTMSVSISFSGYVFGLGSVSRKSSFSIQNPSFSIQNHHFQYKIHRFKFKIYHF